MAPKPLTFRRHADKSDGERVKRYDPETGEAYLADPETWSRDDPSTWVSNPWPFAGVEIVALDGSSLDGKYPKSAVVPNTLVERGLSEGWISLEGDEMVPRPGGPPENPWRVTHMFRQAKAMVFHTVAGDVRYRVKRNPDKYPDSKNERDEGFGGEVFWDYVVELA